MWYQNIKFMRIIIVMNYILSSLNNIWIFMWGEKLKIASRLHIGVNVSRMELPLLLFNLSHKILLLWNTVMRLPAIHSLVVWWILSGRGDTSSWREEFNRPQSFNGCMALRETLRHVRDSVWVGDMAPFSLNEWTLQHSVRLERILFGAELPEHGEYLCKWEYFRLRKSIES